MPGLYNEEEVKGFAEVLVARLSAGESDDFEATKNAYGAAMFAKYKDTEIKNPNKTDPPCTVSEATKTNRGVLIWKSHMYDYSNPGIGHACEWAALNFPDDSDNKDLVFTFGKHKGKSLSQVEVIDKQYLKFILKSEYLSAQMRAAIEKMDFSDLPVASKKRKLTEDKSEEVAQ